ncbi:MAG TPA: heavy metal translocating P-type ATPase [Caulobacteraceae bacterium]|jgi:Cu+-exporting ATPase
MAEHEQGLATLAKDPVCGMSVDPATSAHAFEFAGQTYRFCCAGCRTKFEVNPQRYLAPPAEPPPAALGLASAIHTCPMHPEVRQLGPGACPDCGMALEPAAPTLEEGPNPELADFTRRLWIAAGLTAPVMALDLAGDMLGVPAAWNAWAQAALATPVVLWAGWPFFQRGWASLLRRRLNMFTLIGLGVGVAWLWSLTQMARGGAVYFEAAAAIVTLALAGQVLELRARQRAGGAIRALLSLTPKTARRIGDDGHDHEVPLVSIRVGDRLRLRPGEKVPVDGVALEGLAYIDESLMTGEPTPVEKPPGARLVGGSLNRSGALVMLAERVGGDTALAHIVTAVAEAQRSRAPIQRLADRVSGWFVPAVLVAAAVAALAWFALGPEPRAGHALLAAVSVLIVACPCALGLATPMSVTVGVGRGAQAGILVRDAEALERLAETSVLVLDKTGTLTEGRPSLAALQPAPGVSETELLRLAASLERASEHPLADALTAAARQRGVALTDAAAFAGVIGKGVTGAIDGARVAVGSATLMADEGADVGPLDAWADARRGEGATVVFVACERMTIGAIAIADAVKPGAAEALAALRADGLRLVMITGDARATALAVAAQLGIDEVEAEASPQVKAARVAALKAGGARVAMAGDGVNDAPALAAADVGIAMGGGADVAVASAGVTLPGGDIAALVRARRLARATLANIRQNLAFAFVYNAAGVPIAAGALWPLFHVLLSPQIAAAAMAASSVSVIANALRLRRARL